MGFAWGSWLQWPAVFKLEGQVFYFFFLEGVIYYVDTKSVGTVINYGFSWREITNSNTHKQETFIP